MQMFCGNHSQSRSIFAVAETREICWQMSTEMPETQTRKSRTGWCSWKTSSVTTRWVLFDTDARCREKHLIVTPNGQWRWAVLLSESWLSFRGEKSGMSAVCVQVHNRALQNQTMLRTNRTRWTLGMEAKFEGVDNRNACSKTCWTNNTVLPVFGMRMPFWPEGEHVSHDWEERPAFGHYTS